MRRSAGRWSTSRPLLAAPRSGIGTLAFVVCTYAGTSFAAYINVYLLSVDSLFLTVIIMAAFQALAVYQHRVLLIGIVIALSCVVCSSPSRRRDQRLQLGVYLFAASPHRHAINLARQGAARRCRVQGERGPAHLRRMLPVTDDYHGARSFVAWRPAHGDADAHRDVRDRSDGPPVRARLDPRDLRPHPGGLPGLHRQRLRADGLLQLYILLGGLLSSWSTCPTGWRRLGFIGVKLVLHARHENDLPFLNAERAGRCPDGNGCRRR